MCTLNSSASRQPAIACVPLMVLDLVAFVEEKRVLILFG